MHVKVLKYLSTAFILTLAIVIFPFTQISSAEESHLIENPKLSLNLAQLPKTIDLPDLTMPDFSPITGNLVAMQVLTPEYYTSTSLIQQNLQTSIQNIVDKQAESQSNLSSQIDNYFTSSLPNEFINIPAINNTIIRNVIEKGDTIGKILTSYTSHNKADELIKSCDKIYQLSKVVVGQPYTIVLTPDSKDIQQFEYEVDKTHKLIVNSQDNNFVASLEEIYYDLELVKVEGSINSNLFEAVANVGEYPALAVNIANVFAYDVNFINEIREGDSFSVLVEKLYRNGEFKAYGNMVAANFINQDKKYEAYLFANNDKLEYFNPKGENLKKTLLKAPLSVTRVTSGYSMNRKHPISNKIKAHQAIDYGAPKGTPVLAVGDGSVSFVGTNGGFGKQIVVKHSSGFESLYSHLNGYAANIKKGSKVKQGQTIGFVGSTGIATGPHLDFRLKQNSKYINPTNAIVPRADPIHKNQMTAFQSTITQMRNYLEGKSSLTAYNKKDFNF